MIWVPGHSTGLCATKVQVPGSDKYVMLAADTGYAAASWENGWTPGVCLDRNQAANSLDWMAGIARDPNCIECIANHDPKVKPHIITLE